MKKLIAVFVCTLSICVCCVPAFAANDDGVSSDTYNALREDYNSVLKDYDTLEKNYSSLDTEHTALKEQFDELQEKYDTLQEDFDALKTQGYAISGLDDGIVQPNESMSGIVASVFGTYSPKTQTVSLTLDNGTVVTSQEIIPGVAGMDWHWIAGVFLFSVVLWSFFRFLGVIFKHG